MPPSVLAVMRTRRTLTTSLMTASSTALTASAISLPTGTAVTTSALSPTLTSPVRTPAASLKFPEHQAARTRSGAEEARQTEGYVHLHFEAGSDYLGFLSVYNSWPAISLLSDPYYADYKIRP